MTELLELLIWRQIQIDQSYGSSAKNKHDEAEECDKFFDFLKFAICKRRMATNEQNFKFY